MKRSMMSRTRLREHIFILLFMAQFNEPEDMPRETAIYFENLEKAADDESRAYIEKKAAAILEKQEELDRLIDERAEGWSTARMGRVELAIIRLAAFEIRYDEEIPSSVAINEAVELAKKYGQDNASSFVNGILARIVE